MRHRDGSGHRPNGPLDRRPNGLVPRTPAPKRPGTGCRPAVTIRPARATRSVAPLGLWTRRPAGRGHALRCRHRGTVGCSQPTERLTPSPWRMSWPTPHRRPLSGELGLVLPSFRLFPSSALPFRAASWRGSSLPAGDSSPGTEIASHALARRTIGHSAHLPDALLRCSHQAWPRLATGAPGWPESGARRRRVDRWPEPEERRLGSDLAARPFGPREHWRSMGATPPPRVGRHR